MRWKDDQTPESTPKPSPDRELPEQKAGSSQSDGAGAIYSQDEMEDAVLYGVKKHLQELWDMNVNKDREEKKQGPYSSAFSKLREMAQ